MKQRGGDDRGSSTSLRVVLGATLALAGDAARRELTAPEGPAPDPVREAKKAQRAEKLPEPRFAAAETKLVEAKPGRKTGAKRERKQPAEARLPSPKLAKALPLPESAGVLSPEFREPIVPEPAPSTAPVVKPEAATSLVPRVAEAVSPPPEPPRPAALAANDPLPAPSFGPPAAAAPAPPVAQPDAVTTSRQPVVTPPLPTTALSSPAKVAPAKAAEPQEVATAPVLRQEAVATTTNLATVASERSPEAPSPPAPALVSVAPPAAAAVAPASPPKQPAPELAAPPTPVTPPPPPVKLAEALPSPAFGAAEPPAAGSAQPPPPTPTSSPTRLAYAPATLPLTTVATTAMPAPAPSPKLAAPSLAESRRALPQPAFGTPAAAPKPALTASPLRANVTDQAGLGAATKAPVISEDDELILQIETAQGEMSDTIVAYGLRQGVYLPLGAMTRFLDLPIAVSDDGHYANGWFLNEKRTVTLNLRDGTLVVAGKTVPLGRGDAVAFEGELYLKAERFSDLFPLDLKVDLRAQTIAVKTREPFPFEERLAREADRERLASRTGKEAPARFPREETPWRALSVPVGETELRALTDDDLGARVEADVRLAGDLAFMTARAFASVSSRDGLTAARLELGRRDPDGDLLGPLKATEFQLGDVATGALPVGLRGVTGRGAFVTNAPLEQASIFDSVDLRGDLLDGYEVELYRNNTLIGSTRTPVNGQYAFLQVPVDFGLNVFRLVFYGPQGQRREVVRQISVGDGRLAPGQFVYSLAAAQKDMNLFGVRSPRFSPAPDFGAWRATAQLGYGISRAVTATLGAAWWDSGGKHHWLATTGLRSGIGATALRLDLGLQDGGGSTVEVGFGGKLFGFNYSVNHAEYSGGAIDEVRAFTADPLRRASEFNLNTTLRFGSGLNTRVLPITGQLRRIEFADGRRQTDAALRATLPLGGVLLSNTFDYNRVSATTTPATSRLLGNFDLATLSGSKMRYRAGLGYAILPTPKLQTVTLEADRRFGENMLLRGGVTHTLTDNQTTLGLSAIRRVGPVNVAFDGAYGFPRRNFSVALRVGFSFGRNPLSGHAFLARPGLTSGGAAAVTAFADANANGVRDPDEGPVAGVTFLSGTHESRTDAKGRALIPGLGDGARASLRVDSDSMPDIALAPARPGIEIVPRPGRIHTSDFPIVTLSDIEGTAYFRAATGTRAVSRLQLRLLRRDGSLAARARSESDGFFLFERLPAGEYRLELDPQQAAALKIRLEGPVTLTLGGKSSVLRQSITVKSAN
ncbi:hypothetical protein [Novosphingobium sp. NDB2Meth1]|uniref:hypothetical protein n=1 Tax=Novosphingobium sp. NDB2Meth1 TaxID=1892847 RepID=UPI0009FB4813|nr:hypothetical protein [Novosphingobium sp. NDB2Meth1]